MVKSDGAVVDCVMGRLQTCQVSRHFRESPEMARDLQVSLFTNITECGVKS